MSEPSKRQLAKKQHQELDIHAEFTKINALAEGEDKDEAAVLLRASFQAFDRLHHLTPQLILDMKQLNLYLRKRDLLDDTSMFAVLSPQAQLLGHFVNRYAGAFIHVHSIGWMYWTGSHWTVDKGDKHVTTSVIRLGVDLAAEAQAAGTVKSHTPMLNTASSAGGVANMLILASSLPAFRVDVESLDAEPWLFNVRNGTLDLQTLEFRDHNPLDYITKVANASYDPTASQDEWSAFLERVLPNEEVRSFLQRYIGVSLIGAVLEHVLAILIGTGRNGKGVFYTAVSFMMGDYAISAEQDLLLHRENAHPTGLMDLLGVRFAVVSETDEGRALATATVKRLTGGDTIRARRMRQDFIEFQPSHTPLLVTNKKPIVKGNDPALWERLKVIPFDVYIPPEEQVKGLDEIMKLHAEAILNWAVEGLRDYQARGNRLDEPAAVVVATKNYHSESDDIGRFLDACCILTHSPRDRTLASDLFSLFTEWARDEGIAPLSTRQFGLELTERGIDSVKSNSKTYRTGIRLLVPTPEETELIIEE